MATDVAEICRLCNYDLESSPVIGFANGANFLVPYIPLVAEYEISICDVMLNLVFYRPQGSMKGLRVFELLIAAFVLAVVVCFCVQLSLIRDASIGHVFRGYVPILRATVMPHNFHLGSGIVQSRLYGFDVKHGLVPEDDLLSSEGGIDNGYYVPSVKAIRHSYVASAAELALSIFTFALFVNSAIVIVAGPSLYNNPDAPDADISAMHGLPTQSISIIPSIVIAASVGKSGLNAVSIGLQVALSSSLPFFSTPLIYSTCLSKYMTVKLTILAAGAAHTTITLAEEEEEEHPMTNAWYTAKFSVLLWLIITTLNIANLVLLGLGQ
ncbi:LOW QUALITY PROTEIN: metal iron transporter [Geosmithia morbida]|uniref:Metal iron transporter n=1 Tax=Geosmithia morbida TaxID=1094350 RepID=A0A9P5D351_9HYPO|nr:LOW QUALITY PROTEIN: metal iron transporter [Geosmithia morbida]KAF4120154.1 LOW QUALITY PROTEIN: metal iron transporter [Geosmithia morbida]